MDIKQLQGELSTRVNSSALASLHGQIRLDCGAQELVLQIHDCKLRWLDDSKTADATFYFASPAHAFELLCGSADVMAEFMSGRFRSSGYLLWTFPLLTLFRNA